MPVPRSLIGSDERHTIFCDRCKKRKPRPRMIGLEVSRDPVLAKAELARAGWKTRRTAEGIIYVCDFCQEEEKESPTE